MAAIGYQLRASFAFVERNFNLTKRYWSWELVWMVYSVAESLSVSFIGLGMGVIAGGGEPAPSLDTGYMVLYLLIGTLVWRYLSSIFYWMNDVINIERWEGTIEYTLMAPIHRMTQMAGQTIFSVLYSLLFTGVILGVTALIFKINLSEANLLGAVTVLLAGSFSFIGIGIMSSTLPLLYPEKGEQMSHVFIAVLLLISGVYYPVSVLPGILRDMAVASPATYVLDGVRLALLEGAPTSQLWPYIWPVLLMSLALVPAGLWVFGQAEKYAKRKGKLHRNG